MSPGQGMPRRAHKPCPQPPEFPEWKDKSSGFSVAMKIELFETMRSWQYPRPIRRYDHYCALSCNRCLMARNWFSFAPWWTWCYWYARTWYDLLNELISKIIHNIMSNVWCTIYHIKTCYMYLHVICYTSMYRTRQWRKFQDGKHVGEVGSCKWWMAEPTHQWIKKGWRQRSVVVVLVVSVVAMYL